MKALKELLDRIVRCVNINLRELDYDVHPFVKDLVPFDQLVKFYGFYGITPHHPLDFKFLHSNLGGSYFLGKCRTTNSILYKSDIRGDELKKKGDVFHYQDFQILISRDEEIRIEDSFLIKTLVHNCSHDPETLEKFFISNTLSAHYVNIHGSPTDGCFLGPFATVDLTTMNDCVIGAFSYVQAGEINHLQIRPGTVWVRNLDNFNFRYQYPLDKLKHYIDFTAGERPKGLFMDFVETHKEAFQRVFETVNLMPPAKVPRNASIDRYAAIDPDTQVSDNVLVAQRAFLKNAWLGKGANAQENCYIINSRLEGFNVTAHGAKIIETELGHNIFVGFNSFLRGHSDHRLSVGNESVVMPHTIIDLKEPLNIPAGHLVWGLITGPADLESNSISLKELTKIKGSFSRGNMFFEGNGAKFVAAFRERIHHILEANGAFYNGIKGKGHAQTNQNISFNIIQPYPEGDLKGLFPTTMIRH
ncbi:MAG: transferase [Desulfobacterales bacterium]|jgi:carbonic anhydrase/acetyltransferase-like protein (isoleucine patch superfamily)